MAATVIPTVEPWSLGFTMTGNPPSRSISSSSRSGFHGCAGSSGAQRSTHSGVGTASCTKIRLEIALSIASAEARTPDPV